MRRARQPLLLLVLLATLLFTRTGCSGPSGQELIGAAIRGDAAAVQVLLDAGADVNAKDNMEGRTALLWAASNGHADTVQVLLGAGANVEAQVKDNDEDKEGRTALILAAVGGHTAIVRALIEAGADIKAKTQNEVTAWMAARVLGQSEVVEILRKAGAEE